MTHLVLHKVRGEPAFDVAEQMKVGNEVWWIIPTSGHRAYPYWHKPLWQLSYVPDGEDGRRFNMGTPVEPRAVPADWPDHYAAPDGNIIEPKINIGSLLSKLVPKIKRRI
jgi:hypothetical protein